MNQKQSQTIALFEGKQIRKIWKESKWYFSIIDVIAILTESSNPRDYWFKMKIRVKDESQTELSTICRQFKLVSQDGKMRETDCSDTSGVLRIIQSIPSPKAEPFKQWLAQLGQERIDEIQDPELAMKRMHEIYEKKGYPKDWIDIRTRGIPVRKGLTDEWDMRGGEKAYGILTNEIYKSYSGMDNSGWKKLKGVTSGNLRDHMTPIELILTMLAEQSTKDITKARDAQGVPELKKASRDGGGVALKARGELHSQTGKDPIGGDHYLPKSKKKLK